MYTLMAPMALIRGNKEMKKEKSNVNSGALIYLSLVDWFLEFIKRIAGHFPLTQDSCRLRLYCGMSVPTFSYICSLVMEHMSKSPKYQFDDTSDMSLYDKVAIATRRLKSGESLNLIGEEIGVAHSFTPHNITQSFVEALAENGLHHLQWPVTEEETAPRALDRLKEEWKVLSTAMIPKKRPIMTLACCILHNIVIDMNDGRQRDLSLLQDHDPDYLQETAESINGTSTYRRERLPLYLSGQLNADVLLDTRLDKYFIRLRS